jgi:hypothetical protein
MSKRDDDTPHDPETGELREPGALSAPPHDAQRPPSYTSFAMLLQGLEDGTFNAELTAKMKEVLLALVTHQANYGGKPKGKITVGVEFILDGGMDVRAKFEVKTPLPPRGRTSLWVMGDGSLTPTNPKQMEMFGGRKPRAV